MNKKSRILIVDDSPMNIKVLNDLLKDEYNISISTNGLEALKLADTKKPPDLILLDIIMPDMSGYDVCKKLKANENTKDIPILFVTSLSEPQEEAKGLKLGAADYITKPFSPAIVKSRIRNHMNLRLYQERLEQLVEKRTNQIQESYIETIHRLTLTAEYKDEDTGLHIKRISHYTKLLAGCMGLGAEFAEQIFYASPMHDIGKVAIPDLILLKAGQLNEEEWEVMKSHAEIGSKILEGSESPYLQMAVEIAKYHHERWDGSGYPFGLRGEKIPVSARIMNITDQYDALRSKRPYKTAFDHKKAMSILTKGDSRTKREHFDPNVFSAFSKVSDNFDEIFETCNNSKTYTNER